MMRTVLTKSPEIPAVKWHHINLIIKSVAETTSDILCYQQQWL